MGTGPDPGPEQLGLQRNMVGSFHTEVTEQKENKNTATVRQAGANCPNPESPPAKVPGPSSIPVPKMPALAAHPTLMWSRFTGTI